MSSEIEPRRFVELLGPAVREASLLARRLEGNVANTPKSNEKTEVKQALTAADTEVQEIILAALEEHFPWVGLEAEEDTPRVARFGENRDQRVVIDPIDGTLHSYLRGSGPYSILVGLVVDGVYRAGLVALPREGVVFDAAEGCGAFVARAGGARRPARVGRTGNRILLSHGTSARVDDYLQERGFETVFASGGAVAVAPLIVGVRAGLRSVPAGNGISIRGRIGARVAREAGAIVAGAPGEAFPSTMDSTAHALVVSGTEGDQELLWSALGVAQ